ncbi:hypothetical protein BH20ACI2_BH20ACI2_12640 [soil metagenome]
MNTYSVNDPKYTKPSRETINRGCLNSAALFRGGADSPDMLRHQLFTPLLPQLDGKFLWNSG